MEINKELLQERITLLCKEINKKPTSVFIECGVGKNFFSNLRTSNPSTGKITMLANYFGIDVKYLLGETDQKEKPAETIGEIQAAYDHASEEIKAAVRKLLDV